MIVCPEIKQEQPQDCKTFFEILSLPVAKILSPVERQAPTKTEITIAQKSDLPDRSWVHATSQSP